MIRYYISVWKNAFNFNGRARRSEYWYFVLMHFIILFVLGFIDISQGYENFGISSIYRIAALVPYFSVAVRRMHDTGKSGWYIIAPFYNIILAATEGYYGPNEYGDDPKNPSANFEEETDEAIGSIGQELI